MNIPTFADVLLAQRQIRPYLKPTPLHTYPAMNALIGTDVYIKHENYQPVGAFKVRGGINLISQLSPDEPALQVIIVPIGGGSGASGASIVARAINSSIRVIGVQAAASPAAYESWKQGQLVETSNRTMAEGLATGRAFELPQTIMRQMLKEFMLVSEEEILQAVTWYIERAHTLAEGAGAAPLAAAYRLRDELKGKKVGIVCSGGNVSLEQLKKALALRDNIG